MCIGSPWHHVINLSNNDFLIKPIEELENFLWGLGSTSIIQGAINIDNPIVSRYTVQTFVKMVVNKLKESALFLSYSRTKSNI